MLTYRDRFSLLLYQNLDIIHSYSYSFFMNWNILDCAILPKINKYAILHRYIPFCFLTHLGDGRMALGMGLLSTSCVQNCSRFA